MQYMSSINVYLFIVFLRHLYSNYWLWLLNSSIYVYADDIVVISETKEELQGMLQELATERLKRGLRLNKGKNKDYDQYK